MNNTQLRQTTIARSLLARIMETPGLVFIGYRGYGFRGRVFETGFILNLRMGFIE